jgi:hypothetical protein
MNVEVVKQVPRNKVGDRVTEWMGSSPPPKKIAVEQDAAGTYTITIEFE